MSGYICGQVVFGNKELDDFEKTFNKEIINQYKLDKFDHSFLPCAQFGCGLMYITEESMHEIMPYHDFNASLYITADVILDNRDDLIQELSLSKPDEIITDGFIVLEAYKRWGYDIPKHLLGDFAFAIWDLKKQELFITRDHLGTRSLYYSKKDNSIRFSTTINALISDEINKQKLWSEEWLTMFFALPEGVVDYDINLTMYKDIFQCPIAHTMIITKSEIKMFKYWDPTDLINKNYTKFSKNEWLEAFKSIFNEAVKCRTRSNGNIGIFLSGGLDSTAIAATAAINLKNINKKINSFTSIPLYEVNGYNEKHDVINEKEDVELFVSHFPDINPNYLECVNQDIIYVADELINIIEMPFKAIQNLTWMNEGYRKANSLGCKIMLNGQFGNATISRGQFMTHIQTLKKHGRYFEILDEVGAAAKLHHIRRASILKQILAINIPEVVKRSKRKLFKTEKKLYNPYLLYVKEDLLNKYGVVEKLRKKNLYEISARNTNFYEEGIGMLNEMVMTLVGPYDTKFGLHYGLINRDPTKDVRVIEFCLKAPFQMFVEDGIERKLIRDAMENKVPEEIRMNHNKRGLQGGDWDKRIRHNETNFFRELERLKRNELVFHYLKKEKYQEILGLGSEIFEPQHGNDLKQAIYWIILSKTLSEK